MDKIQNIESELISLQYPDELMLDFLVTDLGSRAVLVGDILSRVQVLHSN